MSFEGSGVVITKIRVGSTEIPCNVDPKNWQTVRELIEKLVEVGVFIAPPSRDALKAFVNRLVDSERRVLRAMPVDQWIPKSQLDSMAGLEGRETAGVLANITKKARDEGIVGPNDTIYESTWRDGEYHYKLKSEFSELKELL